MLSPTDQYKLSLYNNKELLHSSKSSDIFLVISTLTGKLYIKRIYKDINMTQLFNAIKNKHIRNSPEIYEVFYDDRDTVVIEEYVMGYTSDSITLSKSAFYKVIMQVFNSIEDLHSVGIIHRDIKPDNILITSEYKAYLIDFGISRFYSADVGSDTTKLGTKGFASPEQFGFQQTDFRSDIYSLGKTMDALIKDNNIHTNLKPVILKATSFDPDNRYSDVVRLRHAVIFRRYMPVFASSALLLIAVGCIGIYFMADLSEKVSEQTVVLTTEEPSEITTESITLTESTTAESTTQVTKQTTASLTDSFVKLPNKIDAESSEGKSENVLNTNTDTDFLSGIDMPSGVDFMSLLGNETSKTCTIPLNDTDVTVECVKADKGVTLNLSDNLGHTDSAYLTFTNEELSNTAYSTHSFNVYVYFYDYNGDGTTEILVSFTDAYQRNGEMISTVEEANTKYGWGGSPSVNYNMGMAMLIEHTAENGFYIYREIIMPEGDDRLTAYQGTGVFICMESGYLYEPKDGVIQMRSAVAGEP